MTLFAKIKTVKQRVTILLQGHPRLRDSDNKLIANYWHNELGSHDIGVNEFLRRFSLGKFTSPESIRRCRQKIQEQNPELRGSSYGRRKTDAEIIKNEIHEL